jgi:hypothetical protein
LYPFAAAWLKNKSSETKWPFSKDPYHDAIDFGARAIDRLKAARGPWAFCGPVIRVDIFETEAGKLVVNEFESLEALVDAKGRGSDKLDGYMYTHCLNFWIEEIQAVFADIK